MIIIKTEDRRFYFSVLKYNQYLVASTGGGISSSKIITAKWLLVTKNEDNYCDCPGK